MTELISSNPQNSLSCYKSFLLSLPPVTFRPCPTSPVTSPLLSAVMVGDVHPWLAREMSPEPQPGLGLCSSARGLHGWAVAVGTGTLTRGLCGDMDTNAQGTRVDLWYFPTLPVPGAWSLAGCGVVGAGHAAP